jgi:hypothetical protein
MSLTNVINNEFRPLYARYTDTNELGDPLITACIRNGLRRFSRYYPRPNRFADLSIDKDDTFFDLPSDFMLTPFDELYSGLLGLEVHVNGIFSVMDTAGLFSSKSYNIFDTQYGSTDHKPPSIRGWSYPTEIRTAINDQGNFILQFREKFGETKPVQFFYGGIHVISDAVIDVDPVIPAKNSIPEFYKDIFLEQCFGYAALARERALLESDERNAKKANEYARLALKHFSTINDLVSLGSRG